MKYYSIIVALLLLQLSMVCVAYEPILKDQRNIVGMEVRDPAHVDEVVGFTNTVGFRAISAEDLSEYLIAIDNRLVAAPAIGTVFFDGEVYDFTNVSGIVDAIVTITQESGYVGRLLFILDEPMWAIRQACDGGSARACAEIADGYTATLAGFEELAVTLKASWHDAQMYHVEAFAEFWLQETAMGGIKLIPSIDYVGFDCYGRFHDCGIEGLTGVGRIDQPLAVKIVYDAAKAQASGAKVILMAGSFTDSTFFPTEQDVIAQLDAYLALYDSSVVFGGFAALSWSSFEEGGRAFTGARDLPGVKVWLEEHMGARSGRTQED